MKPILIPILLSLSYVSYALYAPTDYPDLVSSLPNFTSSALPTSYAGFAPLDDQNTSALFYWFFPAGGEYNNNLPTLLWLNGGPGAASVSTVMTESGPIRLRANGDGGFSVYCIDQPGKKQSWTAFYNVLYIDSPLGAGYSYTANGNYSTNEDQVAYNVWTAIQYFMNVHPETKSANWYFTGESYGGRFVPATAHWTIQSNEQIQAGQLQGTIINLKGIILSSAFVIGVGQRLTTIDAVQAANLLTPTQYSQAKTIAAECQQLSGMGTNYTSQAVSRCNDLMGYYTAISGIGTMALMISNDAANQFGNGLDQYFNNPDVVKAVHADGTKKQGNPFESGSSHASQALQGEILSNSFDNINFLLTRIPCLFYEGTLDGQDGAYSTRSWFPYLTGTYPEIQNATRNVWYINGFSAGMYTQHENMTYVVVDFAGHLEEIFELNVTVKIIEIFTQRNSNWNYYSGFNPVPTSQIMNQYSNNCNGHGTPTASGICICNQGYGLGDCSVQAVSVSAQAPYPINLNQRGYAFLAIPLNGKDMIAEFQNENGVAGVYYTPFAPGPIADEEEAEASLLPNEYAPASRSLYLNSYGKNVGYLTIQNSQYFNSTSFQLVLTPATQSTRSSLLGIGQGYLFGMTSKELSIALYLLSALFLISTIVILKGSRKVDKSDKATNGKIYQSETTQRLIA